MAVVGGIGGSPISKNLSKKGRQVGTPFFSTPPALPPAIQGAGSPSFETTNGFQDALTPVSLQRRLLLPLAYARVLSMGNQTYMKRQKEMARQQKQRDKAARREQRKTEKKPGGPPIEGQDPVTGEIHPVQHVENY